MKPARIPTQTELAETVSRWAATRPEIVAAWLFGSRVPQSGKSPKGDSDWDIAIQVGGDDPEEIRRWWFDNSDKIHSELEHEVGWRSAHRDTWKGIDVEIQNPPETQNVSDAIATYGQIIYKKS